MGLGGSFNPVLSTSLVPPILLLPPCLRDVQRAGRARIEKSVGRRVRVRHRKIDVAAGLVVESLTDVACSWGQINQSFVM